MSLCTLIRKNGSLWCGADTAISLSADSNTYRIRGLHREKIFVWNDNIIFTAGVMSIGDELKKYITSTQGNNLDIASIQKFLRYTDSDLLSPEIQYRETQVLICTNHGGNIFIKAA